jgi:NAD(P)-dependent dehydrogenase (short-subunit alcohol dehydrogenase family)
MTASESTTALLTNPPSLRLDGKVAWITGASRGLGRAVAFAFAAAGAELLLSARDGAELQRVEQAIREVGRTAHIVAGSVADDSAIEGAIDVAQGEWGRIDVLVNNAGISPSLARAEKIPIGVWDDVLAVNLSGPFRCCRAAFPLLEAAGGSSIVNVTSIHGHVARERLVAYTASKGGLELLTRTLAVEWASRGIRVNAVAPGYLATDMTAGLRHNEELKRDLLGRIPLARFGDPTEIASVVLFLAGSASSYLTGATLVADGGWTAQ